MQHLHLQTSLTIRDVQYAPSNRVSALERLEAWLKTHLPTDKVQKLEQDEFKLMLITPYILQMRISTFSAKFWKH